MIGSFFYVAVTCTLLFVDCCTTAIQLQQNAPTRRHLLLDSDINFSFLSAACANETQYLAKAIYLRFIPTYGTFCKPENATTSSKVCTQDMSFDRENCIELGGQFYDNYTDPDFHRCLQPSNESRGDITTEISLEYYPICAGPSCNTYEVEAAVKETIAADLDDGILGSQIRKLCGLPEKQTASASIARFNFGIIDIIFVSFAILVSAINVF